jgi:DsbC/DsbD-like thiol-disulfide interchange protein
MTRSRLGLAACFLAAVGWFAVRADDEKKKEEKQTGPVKWSAAFEPKSVKPGGEATLKIKATIESGWHIYAVDKPTGLSRKTAFKLAVADKMTPAKDWAIPDPVKYEKAEEETYAYLEDTTFSRKVRVSESADGALEATVTIEFMACNEETCLSPKKVPLKVVLKVAK